MTSSTADRSPEQDEARAIVAEIFIELEAAQQTYGPAYRQVETSGELDPPTRDSAVCVIASAATTLRRLAPSMRPAQPASLKREDLYSKRERKMAASSGSAKQ